VWRERPVGAVGEQSQSLEINGKHCGTKAHGGPLLKIYTNVSLSLQIFLSTV
jgi:hypothetical protein